MTEWLGLLGAAGFLAFGLLAIFRAPNLPLVFLAVGATEFGHWFALVALGGVALIPHASAVGGAAKLLAALSAVLLATPALRAGRNGARFRRRLAEAFGERAVTFRGAALFQPFRPHRPAARSLEIEGNGGPLRIDFYPTSPHFPNPAPLVLVVHGGGWMAGTSEEMSAWNPWLAAQGYAVAAVDYRLVPTGAWPHQREDVLSAVNHLRAHATSLNIDPDRVVLLGRSAGGQIASAIAATGEYSWLRGCVCLYAPFDLKFAYAFGSENDALRSRWLMRSYLGGGPDDQPAHYHEASAYLTATEKSPPFLLLHGGRDELVWVAQSRRFSQRLTELGVPNAFLELPWATHAFDFNLHGPGGQALAASLLAFLRFAFR